MKIDTIENNGPDNLRDLLRRECRKAKDISIGVAFTTQSGLDDVLQAIRQVASTGRVRFLTGLYQKVTEPQALRSLLKVQEETGERFSVHLSTEPKFHRKTYLIRTRSKFSLIVGSSNLTREGLRSGGELNLLVQFPKESLAGRKLIQAFEDDWEHRSVKLVAQQIAEYEKIRPNPSKQENFKKGQLERILGVKPSHLQAKNDTNITVSWRDGITGRAKQKTERIILESTNWDEKDYWWFSTGGSHSYKINDRIILFDFEDKRIRVVKIRDVARTSVTTPDGKHFVAYTLIARLTRRFSKKLWASLAEENIDRKKAHDRRKLTDAQAKRLLDLVRTRQK